LYTPEIVIPALLGLGCYYGHSHHGTRRTQLPERVIRPEHLGLLDIAERVEVQPV
jgi:hypothetical protein